MSQNYTDEELIHALKADRESAWWHYYSARYGKLQAFAQKRFKKYSDWADHANFAINDAIKTIKDKIQDFDSLPEMESYLFKTIHSNCKRELETIYKKLGKEIPEEPESLDDRIAEEITESEVVGSLFAFIEKKINERNRAVLYLHLLNWDTNKIADSLKMRPHQVRKSIVRSLKKLKKL